MSFSISEITDEVRVWYVYNEKEDTVVYLLMWGGEPVFLRDVEEKVKEE